MSAEAKLSRRERQLMDIIWRVGRATVSDVIEQMDDAPSYSAVRTMLGILEQKGQLRHEQEGSRYVYLPAVEREAAQKGALQRLVQTFFAGEAKAAIAALAELPDSGLSKDEVKALSKLIDSAKKEGR